MTFHSIAKSFDTLKVSQPILKHEEIESLTGPVELVTVPAFGPEWQRDELGYVTKVVSGKRGPSLADKSGRNGIEMSGDCVLPALRIFDKIP